MLPKSSVRPARDVPGIERIVMSSRRTDVLFTRLREEFGAKEAEATAVPVERAALELGLTSRTVDAMARAGLLSVTLVAGRRRVARSELRRWKRPLN